MTGRYDSAERRKMVKRGREKGRWLYVPRDELVKLGHDPETATLYSRVWAGRKSTLMVQLYEEK